MVVLFLMVYFSLYIISYGQDVGFTYNTDCYSAGDTMTLTAVYTGSGTVTAVQWYYNGQVAQNLLIVAATCNPFTPIDSGYPASRMTYECNTGTNTFKLVLTGLLEAELNKTWGATFSLSAGSSPSVNQTEITTCQPTTSDCDCCAGCIVGICVGVIGGLLICGSIIYLCLKKFGKNCKDIPIWVWFLCPIVIGLGILTAWLIWEKCGLKRKCSGDSAGNGDVPLRTAKPKPETRSGIQHAGQQMSEKEKKKAKEAEAHTKNEQHDQGKKHREQPPIPDGATGTTLHGRDESDSAVSRQQVELEETGHSLTKSPLSDIPKEKGSKGHGNKIGDSKDDNHPLAGVKTPSQRASALEKL